MSRRSPPLSKLSFDSQHQNAFRLVSLQLHQTSNTRSAFHHQVLSDSPQPRLRVAWPDPPTTPTVSDRLYRP